MNDLVSDHLMIDDSFDFDSLRFSDDDWISELNNDWNLSFDDLDAWFFNNFSYSNKSFVYNWH